jgi:hypothetical protein
MAANDPNSNPFAPVAQVNPQAGTDNFNRQMQALLTTGDLSSQENALAQAQARSNALRRQMSGMQGKDAGTQVAKGATGIEAALQDQMNRESAEDADIDKQLKLEELLKMFGGGAGGTTGAAAGGGSVGSGMDFGGAGVAY